MSYKFCFVSHVIFLGPLSLPYALFPFLVSLGKGLSILFIFSRIQAWIYLLKLSAIFIVFLLLILVCFMCLFELFLIYWGCLVLLYISLLTQLFAVFKWFGIILVSFSFVVTYFCRSSLITLLTHLVSYCLTFVCLCLFQFFFFFLWLLSGFILWLEKWHDVISVILNLLRCVLWSNICVFWRMFNVPLKIRCALLFGGGMCLIYLLKSIWFSLTLFSYWFSSWMIFLLMEVGVEVTYYIELPSICLYVC